MTTLFNAIRPRLSISSQVRQTRSLFLGLFFAAGLSSAWAADPEITVQPASQTVCPGSPVTFTVVATGTEPLSYQWFFNDTDPIPGEDEASLTLDAVEAADAGDYTVFVVSSQGSDTSAVAVLTVNTPTGATGPANLSVCEGAPAIFSTTASGTGPFTYVWRKGGQLLAETSSTLTLNAALKANAGEYRVEVSGVCGSVTNSATLTVHAPPTVTVASEKICLGDSATLTAATGASSPSYLWSPGGQTTASITVSPASTTLYSVLVTDQATSCTATGSGTVEVNTPGVSANPAPIVIADNGPAALYPSTIHIAGQTALVCRVTVTLNQLSHAYPDDLDIVLVGPNGEGVLLMSDVGGGNALLGATLTLDDSAASALPDAAQIVSGTYRPTNFGAKSDGLPDNFPAPAPVSRFGTNLTVFSGIDPNGAWSLYVVDDEMVDVGTILEGWSLAITTLDPFADLQVLQTAAPDPVNARSNLTFTVTVNNLGPAAANAELANVFSGAIDITSATSTAGTCTPSGSSVDCDLGSILAGGTVTVTIVAVPSARGPVMNVATVTSTTTDLFPGNNSATAAVTAVDPPIILTQPAGQVVCATTPVTLEVVVIGALPLSIQWLQDGAPVAGATGLTLSLPSSQPSDSGSYTVSIQNADGTAVSDAALLVVNPLPGAVVNSDTICAGETTTLTAITTTANPIFLWSPGGETTASIMVHPASTTTYTVLVTDAITGCASMGSGTVTVDPLPVVTVNSGTICEGAAITLTASTGAASPIYLWSPGGAATASINVNPTVTTIYTVTVTDGVTGCSSSATGTVTVNPLTRVSPLSNFPAVCPGSSVTFTAAATGTAPLTYVWKKDGVILADQTGTQLTIPAAAASDAGTYMVEVTGGCGSASASGTLAMAIAPAIVSPPAGLDLGQGNRATFSVTASGTTPLSYQWRLNGANIPGATAATYTTDPLACQGGGNYDVVVSNCAGTITSTQALLVVRPVASVFIDFNTPSQYSNNFAGSITAITPPFTYFESGAGGVSASRSIDFATLAGGTDSTAVFTNAAYDFSYNGAVLTASMLVKVKAPTANNRLLQLGFLNRPTTLTGERLTAFMSARVNSTAQPALTFAMQSQSKVLVGTATIDGTQSAGVTLVAGNWYKLSTTFTNIKATVANNYSVTATLQDMGTSGTTPGAVVLTQAPLNVANANIVNDSSVYVGFRGFDNAGADNYDDLSVIVNGGSPASFACQPPSRTILQGRPTVFYAHVQGPTPFTYQWRFGGAPIVGATDWFFSIPAVSPAHAGDYTVAVTTPSGTIVSDPATLTVTPDLIAPVLVSAGSFDGSTIGIAFDEAVDPATATAAVNYIVPDHAADSVSMRPDGRSVLLCLVTPIAGDFTVQVTGVKDLFGNTLATATAGGQVASQMKSIDIGGPLPLGSVYTSKDGDYEVEAGGADVWGNADQFRFTYQAVSGNFDVKTLIADERIALGPGGQIVKAGLHARETLDAGSVAISAYVIPKFPGLERYEAGVRNVSGGGATGTFGWGVDASGDPVNQANIGATHPHSWIRLRRDGNTFTTYSSTNGMNWRLLGITTQPFQPSLLVGMMMTSHAQSYQAGAKFLNYGNFAGYPGAALAFSQNINPVTTNIQAGQTATLRVLAAATGAPGTEIAYTWQRADGLGGWINLQGGYLTGTSNTFVLTTPPMFQSDSGAQFRCLASLPGGATIISDLATVTVSDTVAPAVTAAAIPPYATKEVLLNFSEPLLAATATDTGNYVVTNAAGVSMGILSATFLGNDPTTVLLTTMTPLTVGDYAVVINNVRDRNNNAITPNTVRALRQSAPPTLPVVTEIVGNITGGDLAAMTTYTNSAKYVAKTPDFVFYSTVFGFQVSLVDSTLNNYGARVYSYFTPPSTGLYKFWMRSDDSSLLFMNTNAVNSTSPAGKVQLGSLGAFTGNYTLIAQNVPLNGGQAYYLEAFMKEGTGGDGISVAVRPQADASTPPNTEVISGTMLSYPSGEAAPTPVIVETYTGIGGNTLADLTNVVNSSAFINNTPNFLSYAKDFGQVRDMANSSLDNYGARLFSYFVPPSTGLYRFWARSDDASQLYMNTNAVNSTDPAGKVLLGQLTAFTGTFTQMAQNVPLIGGQSYYIEARYKEGTGGDGYNLAVRPQSDSAVPPSTEAAPGNLFQFPADLARLGAVTLAGITPLNPIISEGQSVTFTATGLKGSSLGLGFTWLRDGVVVHGSSSSYTTPRLYAGDDGSVYTLMVSNAFSQIQQSSMVTVNVDGIPPTLVGAESSRLGDSVTLTFSEPVDVNTAGSLACYTVSPSLGLFSVAVDPSQTRVFIKTAPQTPGVTYTITVNDVRDLAGNAIPPNSSAIFTPWVVGGCGLLIEYFGNIPGTAVENLTSAASFVANQPDFMRYTNTSFSGQNLADNYGIRMSGFFVAPSNGVYRFYIRSDDGSRLFINTNATDSANPAGKSMVADVPSANLNFTDPRTVTAGIPMNNGQAYYLEALMKEGGGGDYLQLNFRESNDVSVPANLEVGSARHFTTWGNPDTARLMISQSPPEEMSVFENDEVNLTIVASALPVNLVPMLCYQWQKFDPISGAYTNIPGATASTLSFFANLNDDGASYRGRASIPGTNVTYATLFHVAPDTQAPFIVSATSLDGRSIGLRFNEPVLESSVNDPFNYLVNDNTPASSAVFRSDRRSVLLQLTEPITGFFSVSVGGAVDLAADPNEGDSSAIGVVQGFTPLDVGAPTAVGSSFSAMVGEIDVIAGGADIWGASDQGHLTLTPRRGNFDIHARVQSLTRPDAISKAGLMVRNTLDANSPTLYLSVNPPASLGGRDLGEAGQRLTVGGGTTAFTTGSTFSPVGIPNAWLRLKRVGNVFTAYRALDGVNWTQFATTTADFPSTVLIGVATTAHNNAAPATMAEYRNVHIPFPPAFLTQPSPATQTVPLHSSVTFTVSVSSPLESGPVAFQWYRDGAAIAGATTDTLSIPNAAVADSGTYTVTAGNDGGETLSQAAVLIVANQLPIVGNDTLATMPNVLLSVPAAVLLANDTDPEGDPLAFLGVSGIQPVLYQSDFNSGLPAGSAVFGSAFPDGTGGINGSGVLKLTINANNLNGSFIIPNLTGTRAVSSFRARFKILVGLGSGNPADGFSFTFGTDIPDGPFGNGEEGTGNGLIVAFDNYDNGGGEAPAVDIKWGGATIGHVLIPKIRETTYKDVAINLSPDGKVDVSFGGTAIYSGFQTPYEPLSGGRFALAARTGGENEAHYVDDLSLLVMTLDTARGGIVGYDTGTGNVSYTPPTGACGPDTFYYVVSDGQLGGLAVGTVHVNIDAAVPSAPVITACATPQALEAGANCLAAIPDLAGTLVVVDCAPFTVTQNPVAGTLVGLGVHPVTFTVANSYGLSATCGTTVTVEDHTPPVIVDCPPAVALSAGPGCLVLLPDLRPLVNATDVCQPVVILQSPAPGTPVTLGPTVVTLTASDPSGNEASCVVTVTVADTTAPLLTCPPVVNADCGGEQGAVVTYTVTATDNCDPNPTVTCVPASGSNFGPGTTTVDCTATDASGNVSHCSFDVIVADAEGPQLLITRHDDTLTICWPVTCDNYQLEETTSLNAPIHWENNTTMVQTADGDHCVSLIVLSTDPQVRFFRLRKITQP